MIPLKNEASLVACKRVLAELYNGQALDLEMKVKILTALGYGDALKEVGALLSGQAHLTKSGVIEYDATEAESAWVASSHSCLED